MDPLRVAAASEAATGLVLIGFPQPVAQLLFGADAAGVGVVIARVAGMALVALGIACWPKVGSDVGAGRTAMLVYSALATVYLSALAVDGEFRGVLLWPAVVAHLALTILLARTLARRAAR